MGEKELKVGDFIAVRISVPATITAIRVERGQTIYTIDVSSYETLVVESQIVYKY